MAALKENLTKKVKDAIGLSRARGASPKKMMKQEASTSASSVSGTDTPSDKDKPAKPEFKI